MNEIDITMSKLIQKHFGKIALGTGLGFAGVAQLLPNIGTSVENEAILGRMKYFFKIFFLNFKSSSS